MNEVNELKRIPVFPNAARRPTGFRIDNPQEIWLDGKFSKSKVTLSRGIWIAMEVLHGEGSRKSWAIETKRIG